MQPLWQTVWQFLKKLNLQQSYDSAILLLVIYPRKMKTYAHTTTYRWMFIAALSVIAPNCKQPRCLSVGEWLNKPEYIHTMGTTQQWRGINFIQKLERISRELWWAKKKPKVYILYDSIYVIFSKWKKFRNKEQISGCPELRKENRGKEEGGCGYERATRGILVMDCGGRYT